MYNIVVIGGGPAGVTAALRARELGASVALVERNRLGGTCTNDGCVPTRVLAHAARLVREAGQFGDYGLFIEEPEVDFTRLLARVQQVVYTMHEKKQLIDTLQDSGVTVYLSAGEAQFVDPHTIRLGDGTQLQGEKFILCAGGHARRLSFPGAEYALTHNDIWSMKALPKSVVMVGASATGCQVASILSAFGVEVWLVDVSPRILPVEDESVSRCIEDAFKQRGIHILLSTGGADHIEKDEDNLAFYYKLQREGQETGRIDTEAVIMATGWPGNVDSMNLEAAGVKTERSYIVVDDYLRTSAGHIFAAGDINGRMMLVQSAGYDARIAVENAVLGIGLPYKHQIVPHGGFTDPEYGSVGMTEAQARAKEDVVVGEVSYASMDRAVIDGHTDGFCKLIVSRENHRILGAHVVGEQALEIVHIVAAGMASNIWVEQLAELEIAYPTFTSIVGLAARSIIRELGVVPLAAEWQALGKPHVAEWERRE
jgi:pyruvate/2-oxoglutarate dehydrogenase complex dihydrolipoamide dehydrogenase (E3) component